MITIAIYQTDKEIGRGNKKHRELVQSEVKKRVYRILFMELEVDELQVLDSFSLQELPHILNDSLNENHNTRYMN